MKPNSRKLGVWVALAKMQRHQRTFATPKFSIAGILWPVFSPSIDINAAHTQSVVSALFSLERTSEI